MGIQERRLRERNARRQSVLDAARTMVLERGFNGTTTKSIAERCELSEATLFHYFQNKDEILLSLLFEGISYTGDLLEKIIAADLPPKERLARLWKTYTMITSEHPEYVHVFGHLARPMATMNISEEIKSEIANASGDNFRRLAVILQGVVPPGAERVAADLLWGSFIGLKTLRDTRKNLGAVPLPSGRELDQAFEFLDAGLRGASHKGDE
ncbi:MAG: TetR/AcrR family transcriptional regulator [Hyphomicrobiales bacterium]|nr:TetR/AcrR family transcriptional regulator [Hyphomicrobiales bacterium]MCP5073534.1 TetR/AcrR family transcriptional regulator [Paracoccaceae bacterium]